MPNQRSKQKTITNFFSSRPVKNKLTALARLLGKSQTDVLIELINQRFSQYGEEITKPILRTLAHEQQSSPQKKSKGKRRPLAPDGEKPPA